MALSRFLLESRILFATALALPLWTTLATAGVIWVPGPSEALFATPYYSCTTNYYVAATGSDSNKGTSSGTPWKTLQHANNSLPKGGAAAGSCINVAPGTYSGVNLTVSGNLASATGYVTWRCTTMDACNIKGTAGPNGNTAFSAVGTGVANYVFIDGFTMTGNGSTYGLGVEFAGNTSGVAGVFGSHHDWVINSVISGFGQGGIGFNEGDYTYAEHNKIFGNANAPGCNNWAQGSGLGDNIPLDIKFQYPNYVVTADDTGTQNPYIGSFTNGAGGWFHKVYSWNVIFNNYLSPCSPGAYQDTDGNGIILDTFGTVNGNVVDYPDQTKIVFNVVYNVGGGGIHIYASENATVANNTIYNAGLDPNANGGHPAMDSNNSYNDVFFNNLVVTIPLATTGCNYTPSVAAPPGSYNSTILGGVLAGKTLDVFTHNMTQLQGGNTSCWGLRQGATNVGVTPSANSENPMFNGDTYSTTLNWLNKNPLWVGAGTTSTGTQSTPPVGANFALRPGSPAISVGLTKPYLSSQSVDLGACYHTLLTCP